MSLGKLTAHSITVLILVKKCVESPQSSSQLLSIIFAEIQRGSAATGSLPTLAEFQQILTSKGASIDVVSSLRTFDSPDSVDTFFMSLTELLATDKTSAGLRRLERSSALGLYVRAAIVLYHKCGFSGLSRLYDELCEYRSGVTPAKTAPAAPAQVTRLLTQKAEDIQSMIGRIPFAETERMIEAMLTKCPAADIPQALFLRYLNCLHHREFQASLDSLHRYFDYFAVATTGKEESVPTGFSTQQYAILNLAMLHYSFGHHELTVRAIEETVRIAQQNNDHVCLMHALSLMCRLAQEKGGKGDTLYARQLLERCIKTQAHAVRRAQRERDMWKAHHRDVPKPPPPPKDSYLPPVPAVDSGSWLAMAKLQLQHILLEKGASSPQDVWSSLAKAQTVNSTHHQQSLQGTSLLLRASAWSHFGARELTTLYASMHLRFYQNKAPSSDSALALWMSLAEPQAKDKNLTILFERGRSRYPYPAHIAIQELTAFSEFDRAVLRNDVETCELLAAHIFALCPATSSNFHLQLEAHSVHARLLALRGEYSLGVSKLMQLVKACQDRGLLVESTRFLLYTAELHQGEQGNNSLYALPSIMHCVSLCEKLQLHSHAAIAAVALARMHLDLESPTQALDTISAVIPHILEHCALSVAADAYVLHARALLALPMEEKQRYSTSWLSEVIKYLENASRWCEEVRYYRRGLECHYLLARCYHEMCYCEEGKEEAAGGIGGSEGESAIQKWQSLRNASALSWQTMIMVGHY